MTSLCCPHCGYQVLSLRHARHAPIPPSSEARVAEGSPTNQPVPAAAEAAPPAAPSQLKAPLTLRERQIIRLVTQGYRNKEIAGKLFITEHTVKNHLHNIFQKLEVFDQIRISDRLTLALWAIHSGLALIPPDRNEKDNQ